MAHDDAREGKWMGNWRMEWVVSTLHTTSEHGVSSITTADEYTSAASSRLNWRPRRFNRTRPFRRKTNSGFCACAITFQTRSTCLISDHLAEGYVRPNSTFRSVCTYWLLAVGPSSKINSLYHLQYKYTESAKKNLHKLQRKKTLCFMLVLAGIKLNFKYLSACPSSTRI